MDESVEIIQCEIQCEIYERQIKALIEKLLQIDEETKPVEYESQNAVQGDCGNPAMQKIRGAA